MEDRNNTHSESKNDNNEDGSLPRIVDTNAHSESENNAHRILIIDKYPSLGLVTLFSLTLGYWLALPSEIRYHKNTLVEIGTMIPLFAVIVGAAFEYFGGIILISLSSGLKKWREYQILREAQRYAEQKEKEERERERGEAYQKGIIEGERRANEHSNGQNNDRK